MLYGKTHARLADPKLENWKYLNASVSHFWPNKLIWLADKKSYSAVSGESFLSLAVAVSFKQRIAETFAADTTLRVLGFWIA